MVALDLASLKLVHLGRWASLDDPDHAAQYQRQWRVLHAL